MVKKINKKAAKAKHLAVKGGVSKKKAKPKPCMTCTDISCFKKPKGVDDKEFKRQLKEQEDAINNTTADELVKRRDAIRKAGGTGGVRVHSAQNKARKAYVAKQTAKHSKTMSPAKARAAAAKDASTRAATHRLDIIAGGNPRDISGMGDSRTNSSMGAQWRGQRSQSLENQAQAMKKKGKGNQKMKVKLKQCA